MFYSLEQIKRGRENQDRSNIHEYRMDTDPEYAANFERQQREYEEFCQKYGEPE